MTLWADPRTRRWLIWTVLASAFLLVNLHRLSTAVLADRLMSAFGTTGVQLGNLHAGFFYVYALMQLPTGILLDRYGTRATAATGTALMSIGAVVFATSNSYLPALLGRSIIGLGGSVLYLSILHVGVTWFRPNEFATLTGLTTGVAGLGGILATTPLAVTVDALGWRSTITGLALVGFALAISIWLLVTDTTHPTTTDRPHDTPTPRPPPAPTSPSFRQIATNTRHVLRDPVTWLLGIALFAATGITITIIGLWGVPYVVQTYGVTVATASLFTLSGSIGFMLGPPTIGWLSDRLGRRTILLTTGSLLYFLAIAFLALTGNPPLPVIAVIFFALGGFMGAFALSYAIVKERNPATAGGVSTGTVNTAAFLGAAVLPTLMGYALDAFWTGETIAGARVYTLTGYRVAFGIAALAALVALACTLLIRARPDHARGTPPPRTTQHDREPNP